MYIATGGDRVSDGGLRGLRERVVALARDSGFPEESTRTARARFDLDLAAMLHADLDLTPAEAASGDVWAFLALVVLPDVAHWRYPRPPRDRILATDLTRHVFGRLWWRAQLIHDPVSTSPYAALEILGEAAFDQIYARRKALGGSPHLVRGILRVWETLAFDNVNERDVLRDFLKRLLRLAPFVLFEALEDEELDAELHAVATESMAALRTPQTETDATVVVTERPAEAAPESLAPVRPVAPRTPPGPRPAPTTVRASSRLTSLEICAGAGGLALGLENAGFDPVLLIDNLPVACQTLRENRPGWNVHEADLLTFDPADHLEEYRLNSIDLLSAGLPRLKAAAAVNRERGNEYELSVLRATVELARYLRPRALLLENVPDLVTSNVYEPVRHQLDEALTVLGYQLKWFVVDAADHGVPQYRKQGILVAMRGRATAAFRVPEGTSEPPLTVGQALGASMASGGWTDAPRWAEQANRVAPTLVGGSWERGGADLGPTGSKYAWARMGVDGGTVADDVPGPDFRWDPQLGRTGLVPLTVEQAACLQSFPKDWHFAGRKTARYRQVGHASPPPVGEALGRAVGAALRSEQAELDPAEQ
ncbi:DNA cytosine methyltransferase [Streptomyces sp. NBC_01186]|uniref:DNA cytosine methyltransferase n=1 Tax=Streptomyces sp. NBC_01186 TaxID=2903765 RepID=UPI002E147F80